MNFKSLNCNIFWCSISALSVPLDSETRILSEFCLGHPLVLPKRDGISGDLKF